MSYQILTPEMVNHFLTHGYVLIPEAFTLAQSNEWTSNLWTRLGYSPTDPSTWLAERINMPWHARLDVRTFSPKAWHAICDLLGGEQRINPGSSSWSDGFIVNLGTPTPGENDPKKLDGWHVDGDFFIHFLDSKEQALLVIPLFSDIEPNGGGTMVCPDGIGKIARYLRDHPQGVLPRMTPVEAGEETFDGLEWYNTTIQSCSDFREMTGKTGDVILMHPFMLHSASKNILRTPRVIINPPVSLNEPFNLDRDDPNEYSLVERKTLRELGVDRLTGWKITGERREIVPERVRAQEKMKREEEARLRGEAIEPNRGGGIMV